MFKSLLDYSHVVGKIKCMLTNGCLKKSMKHYSSDVTYTEQKITKQNHFNLSITLLAPSCDMKLPFLIGATIWNREINANYID